MLVVQFKRREAIAGSPPVSKIEQGIEWARFMLVGNRCAKLEKDHIDIWVSIDVDVVNIGIPKLDIVCRAVPRETTTLGDAQRDITIRIVKFQGHL